MSKNITVSGHPCVKAKLAQLRSKNRTARETRDLVHEISLLLAVDVLAATLVTQTGGQDETPLGATYDVEEVVTKCVLVPILRSGLGMVEAFTTVLPSAVPVHHLGLFREKVTLSPVEYYNNLPVAQNAPADIAFILDPVIATGGTAEAAIQTLKEWGVKRIVVVSVLAAKAGVERAANEWPEGTHVYLGGMDDSTNEKGMILPGLGDIGDRLFLTVGK